MQFKLQQCHLAADIVRLTQETRTLRYVTVAVYLQVLVNIHDN